MAIRLPLQKIFADNLAVFSSSLPEAFYPVWSLLQTLPICRQKIVDRDGQGSVAGRGSALVGISLGTRLKIRMYRPVRGQFQFIGQPTDTALNDKGPRARRTAERTWLVALMAWNILCEVEEDRSFSPVEK
jgi:hypothetical protein